MSTTAEKPGVWVGLLRCGCCVGVVVDDSQKTARANDVAKTKQEFLDEGLSVVYGTWAEWQEKYLPSMSTDCEHAK